MSYAVGGDRLVEKIKKKLGDLTIRERCKILPSLKNEVISDLNAVLQRSTDDQIVDLFYGFVAGGAINTLSPFVPYLAQTNVADIAASCRYPPINWLIEQIDYTYDIYDETNKNDLLTFLSKLKAQAPRYFKMHDRYNALPCSLFTGKCVRMKAVLKP